MMATAYQIAILVVIQTVLGGLMVIWYGRWPAVRHGWPLVLVISAIQGLGQIVAVAIDPALAAFLPATAALLALFPLARWKRFALPAPSIVDRPAMLTSAMDTTDDKVPPMSTTMAFLPYIVLSIIAVGTSVIEPLRAALSSFTFGFPFPTVSTGYGLVLPGTDAYSALRPFSHPGAGLVVTAILTWVLFQFRGYFSKWAQTTQNASQSIVRGLVETAVPASVPIIAFLIMASIMNHSGQNEVLALGISAVAPAYAFAFLSNGIGVVGAFTTSSSTSSNVLFSDLQITIARLKDLPEATILAAQSAGGAIGNAIAPANVVMGASTAGISGKEGEIMRKTLPWTIVAFLLTGVATVLLVVIA